MTRGRSRSTPSIITTTATNTGHTAMANAAAASTPSAPASHRSSLAYCLTAEKGGYTLFTRVGLKVVPKRRQLLFFGYFYNDAIGIGKAMDK